MPLPSPFEHDIAEQPAALRRLAAASPIVSRDVVGEQFRTIVLTGMGSSDYVSIPTWRSLVGAGHTAWRVDTGELLENPKLITADTLLVVTSQSGASGEVVQLLDRLDGRSLTAGRVVGITDDPLSPLASRADVTLELLSGPEATVSTKSYLNTLGVHRQLSTALRGEAADPAAELEQAACVVEEMIRSVHLEDVAAEVVRHPAQRLAYIGTGDHVASSSFAALITKESSKVAAQGYTPGQFRHGPLELAGDGLTAVFFGMIDGEDLGAMSRLATDLVESGSRVVLVGDWRIPGALSIPVPASGGLGQVCADSVVAELFAVALARAKGLVPGEFLYGSKITTTVS